MPILLGIVLYVAVEIAAVVAVASWLGIGWTLLLLLGLSLLGLVLLRHEGGRAWRSFQLAVAAGRPPGREVLDGMLVLLGAVLIVLPGFVTDVLALFGVNTGLYRNGPIGIIFCLVCIVVASLSFILDFDQIEQGVRMGLPRRYAWQCAFGMLVGLIWLYLEILRLLSFLQGSSRD